jgi:uncharacterized protein DUF1918
MRTTDTIGVIVGQRHADGTPPHTVRWLDNNREPRRTPTARLWAAQARRTAHQHLAGLPGMCGTS